MTLQGEGTFESLSDPCRACLHEPHSRALTRVGMWGPVAAVIGASLFGIYFDVPPWVVEMTRIWGPGFLMIAILLSGVAYYVPRETVPHFIQSQKDQAVALSQVADQMSIMNTQAGKLDEIKTMIGEVRFEQRIIVDRLKNVEEGLERGRESNS